MLNISTPIDLLENTERDRLEELRDYGIVGTDPEPRFDAIARAAGTLLGMPMAFLTLIDEDRQWFKAAVGLDVRETPRSVSFCTHTIMSNEVMVVPDARLDPRFAENILVTGAPHVRFYAGAPLVTENGFRIGALCVIDVVPRDFTAGQRSALKDLAALAMHQIWARRSESSTVALAGLAQSLAQPLLAISPNGMVEFANRPAADFFDLDIADLKGMAADKLLLPGRLRMDIGGLIEVFREARPGMISRPLKRIAVKADGSEVPVELTLSRWDAASGAGIAVVIRDLAEKAASALTMLASGMGREGSDVAITRVLDGLLAQHRHPGVFLVSIDNFDKFCDKFGRHMGHSLLQSVSVRLQQMFPQARIAARAKGDDFAVVFDGIDTVVDGWRISAQLSDSFEEVFDLGVGLLQITASIGFALADCHADKADLMIANAGFALSEAKRSRSRGIVQYEASLRLRSNERHQIQLELMRALKNGEFCLFYQPQVSLEDGRILGVEALIRWQHPTRGILSPADFLLDIEEGGLSLPIGWWTLETACAQLATWRAAGLPETRMGVNLFASQFRSERLVSHVMGLLRRYDIAPHLLELEVTETITLLQNEGGLESLRALRDAGIRIAFDDFGTGYASLSSLQQFPLTTLKLDRRFVRDILSNPSDAVITRSMIAMANDLALSTIAEGVETREQEAFLRLLGCEACQGYLYSQAVPAEEMAALLSQAAENPDSRSATCQLLV